MAATTTETTARATMEPETTGHRAHQRLLEAVQALRSHTETSSALPADIHRALSEALGELGARPPAPAPAPAPAPDATTSTTTTTSSTSSTAPPPAAAAPAAAAPVQEAEEVEAATLALATATQALVEAVRYALASELSSSEQAAALANAVGLLCNATTSDRVVEAFVAQQALPPLIEVLQRTVPSETSSKHRAHLDAAALSEMLNNAMHGQLPRATAGDAVESDESLLYRSLETARRHAVVALRNISQQQRSRNAVSRAPGLVDALLSLFRNPCETGVSVFYGATILRNLLTPIDDNDNDAASNAAAIESISAQAMEHEHYRYIIGNAVTRRVITLPEGRSLVVHIESTRALVRLIMACDKYHAHELVHFLDGLAIRPLSEIVLSTTSPLLHHELAQAMDILLRANGGSAQSFVAKCRNFVVNAAVALIVFGAKNIVSLYHNHTASELQTAELQRELECSRESCQIGVRFIDALLNVPNAATDILPYLLQQNGAGVLQVAARTHISEALPVYQRLCRESHIEPAPEAELLPIELVPKSLARQRIVPTIISAEEEDHDEPGWFAQLRSYCAIL